MIGYGEKSTFELEQSIAFDVHEMAELVDALRQVEIELGEEVIVFGTGHTAQLVADLARRSGAISVKIVTPERGSADTKPTADVVVHLAGAGSLNSALALVRNAGRALLLGSLPSEVADFDLYPDLHKRSVQLICPHAAATPSPQAIAFAQHLAKSG